MIRDLNDLQDLAEVRTEVGVLGAGFAGLDLARYLGRQGMNVVVLESGREQSCIESAGKPVRKPDRNSPFTPHLPLIFRGEFRVRQFGGTSNIWTAASNAAVVHGR